MTKLKFKIGAIAFAIIVFIVSCGSGNSNKQSSTSETQTEQAAGTVVQIVSVDTYNFNKERGTVRLNVEFDNPVSGLMLRDVTVSVGSVSLVQCGSGNTKFWRIDIEGLPNTTPQEVTVTINKSGYTFEPKSKNVTLDIDR